MAVSTSPRRQAPPPSRRLPRVLEGFDLSSFGWLTVSILLAGHGALGLFADSSPPPLATMHAYVSLAVVGWILLTSRRADAFAAAAAYVTGAEVLWRMTGTPIPWETSKYAVAGIALIGMIRLVGRQPRRVGLSVIYIAFLMPSILVTVERFGLLGAWESLSFNVLAHLALACGVAFFANIVSDRAALTTVLWALLAPILAVNSIATRSTASLSTGDFDAGLANTAASGGYGPNQVSALVGLAVLACVFLVLFEHRWQLRIVAAVLGIWFTAQGALTFSRGGLFNVAVALVFAAPFFLRTARHAVRFLGAAAVVTFSVVVILIPVINGITGGSFEERFASKSTTLRGDLAAEEVAVFVDNPGFGTGVGLSERNNPFDEVRIASHTEFSRLLAEHGVLGIGAIMVLLAMLVRGVHTQRDPMAKAFSIACSAWALAEMSHSATRLAAVAFVFALGQLVLRVPAHDRSLSPAGGRSASVVPS